jgi:hypothetical protein
MHESKKSTVHQPTKQPSDQQRKKILTNKRFSVQLWDKEKEQCYSKQTTKSNPAHAANLKP